MLKLWQLGQAAGHEFLKRACSLTVGRKSGWKGATGFREERKKYSEMKLAAVLFLAACVALGYAQPAPKCGKVDDDYLSIL